MTNPIYSCGETSAKYIEARGKTSQERFANAVFSNLKAAGLLKPGVKAKDIENKFVTDVDADGRPEINWVALSDFLVKDDFQPVFGTKDNITRARESLLADQNFENYIEDLTPETGGGEDRFLDPKVKLDVQASFSTNTPIGKVSEKFQGVYKMSSVDGLNKYLNVYLRLFFIHSARAFAPENCNVSADVNENTAPADFRSSHINNRPQAVIDCDVFAKIGFAILSKINNGAAFDIAFVLIESREPSRPPHVILSYKERSSGRTFVLDSNIVCEMKDGETYFDWVRGYRPGRITEYRTPEDLDRRERGRVVFDQGLLP